MPPLQENSLDIPEECYEKVKRYSLLFEKFMHGNPSGIDNAVATYGTLLLTTLSRSRCLLLGGIVTFKKGEISNIPGYGIDLLLSVLLVDV